MFVESRTARILELGCASFDLLPSFGGLPSPRVTPLHAAELGTCADIVWTSLVLHVLTAQPARFRGQAKGTPSKEPGPLLCAVRLVSVQIYETA